MAEITTKTCGVTFESFFKKAVVFNDAHCSEIAQKCLEAYSSYGLKPSQIAVRRGDQTFDYDLSFSLFNGNGTFRITSEKLDVGLRNATSARDLEIVHDCVAKIYEHVPLPEIGNTAISANAHASFPSVESMEQYLSRYANPTRQVVSGGTIAYVRCENWEQEIRIVLDKSVVFPASLYATWSTTYSGATITRDLLKNVQEVFEGAVSKFDLVFAKTTQ